jgi:hypothetical protein
MSIWRASPASSRRKAETAKAEAAKAESWRVSQSCVDAGPPSDYTPASREGLRKHRPALTHFQQVAFRTRQARA